MDKKTIDNNYQYHAPSEEQAKQYAKIRQEAKRLANIVNKLCPESREKSLSLTKLEEVVMWANASIARNSEAE